MRPGSVDHFVGGFRRVQQPLGLFGTRHWKQCGVEKFDLHQQRRLIPIDVLIGHAALSVMVVLLPTEASRPPPAATPPRLRPRFPPKNHGWPVRPPRKPRSGRWNFKIGPEYAIIARQSIAALLGIGCMNSRHSLPALSAIVSLLWLAATSDSRAAEERPASFDCVKDRGPLASIVCSDQSAILAERRTAIAYLALFFSLDENGRARFRTDHLHWVNDLTARCIASPSALQKLLGAAPTAPSRECVSRAYMLRAETYRRKLHGSALEEANLSPNELRKIQRRLVELKFLSGSIDGTFGVETRSAIRNYQSSIDHDQANFLTAEERNMLLE